MPKIAEQLERLNDNIEELLAMLQKQREALTATVPRPANEAQ